MIWLLLVATPLIAWLAYLAFMAWVVRRTGTTTGLRDVAVAARAFPFIRRGTGR